MVKKPNRSQQVDTWAPAPAADPDLEIIREAMDLLDVQLVALEHNGHMYWYWSGHDPEHDSRTWSTREDAVCAMRSLLRDHDQVE